MRSELGSISDPTTRIRWSPFRGVGKLDSELGSEFALKVSIEIVVGDCSYPVVREARHPGGVVERLRGDLSWRPVSLQLHHHEVALEIDTQDVDEAAKVSFDFATYHQQRGIQNRDVAREPLLQPRLEV